MKKIGKSIQLQQSPAPRFPARLSMLLSVLLIWDFISAPAGASALERTYRAVSQSAFMRTLVDNVKTGKLWRDRFPDFDDTDGNSGLGNGSGAATPASAKLVIEPENFSKAPLAPKEVLREIAAAGHRTGADTDWLVRTAFWESGLDPSARAATSTATGPFQFLEQTWLEMLHGYGGKYGLEALADQITRTQAGRFSVRSPQTREKILSLRFDTYTSALMAAEFTRENSVALKNLLGRSATDIELYVAFVLGARGAGRLLNTLEDKPDTKASTLFPAAARANKGLFYDSRNVPRTASDLYQMLTQPSGFEKISQHQGIDANAAWIKIGHAPTVEDRPVFS